MDLLRAYFPDLSPRQLEQFSQLQELYTFWNNQINVISRKDMDQLYERHVLHSLAIAKFIHFKPGTRLLDIGTGGGFPAIPLAIFFPGIEIWAVDSIAKKIKVVTEVAHSLQLESVHPWCGRVEQVNRTFDFIVNRAVAPLSELYKWTQKYIDTQNRNDITNGMLSLKGGDLEAEIKDLKMHIKGLKVHQQALSPYFKEPFFETKSLVYSFKGDLRS